MQFFKKNYKLIIFKKTNVDHPHIQFTFMVVHRINIFGGRIQLVQDLNMVHFLKGAKRFSAENSGLYKTVTKKKNRREYNKKGKNN